MDELDVVIVGAGPCGSAAARAAVEHGANTVLIEEHAQIGLPEHCEGRLVGTESGFLEELVQTMDNRVVVAEQIARRIYSPSGKMVEIDLRGKGAKIVERSLFDLEMGRQAADAGAQIIVNTRVTGLIKMDGFVKGVTTNSRTTPEVRAKVVIAADGINSLVKGIPLWEGLSKKDTPMFVTLKLLLTGIKDIEPGIVEMHLGPWDSTPRRRNWMFVIPHSASTCTVSFSTLKDFEKIRLGDWPLSRKIRDCKVLRMTAVSTPVGLGEVLPKITKNGLILAGNAANYIGFDSAVISGQYAGQAAARAVRKGSFEKQKLYEYYEQPVRKKISYPRGRYMKTLYNLSVPEIEEYFRKEMSTADEFTCDDVIPI